MNKKLISTLGLCSSVIQLLNRIVFLPFFLTTAACVGLQCAVYFFICRNNAQDEPFHILYSYEAPMESPFLFLIIGLGFFLVCWLLTRAGANSSGKCGYTIRRLSLPEKSIFLLQSVYNAALLFLFWAAQVGAVLLMYRIYIAVFGSAAVTGQSLALGFYCSAYLHGLIPLEEPLSFALNLWMVAELGFVLAAYPFHQRRRRKGASKAWLLVFWTGLYFSRKPTMDFRIIMLAVLYALYLVYECLAVFSADNDEEAVA